MMATEIKLLGDVWKIDESHPLGAPGGFGEVFLGTGRTGDVAIKRLKLTATSAAHRELKIGQALATRSLEHVVPVLDSGQDAETDRYYLVMPVCEYSLQEVLNNKGALDWGSAKRAALDIIAGLTEVGDIVHRDLKPGNVLWHEGKWKVADFGIAKFVEDSTSLETLRGSLTPAYGAPEQWNGEPPTRATDVYALGCILYAMNSGKPPFQGDTDAIRWAHLNTVPPDLPSADPRLNGLIQFMLRKSHQSRPSLTRCTTVIAGITDQPQRSSSSALVIAGGVIAREQAVAEAQRRAVETARKERGQLINEANAQLKLIFNRLFKEISSASEAVHIEKNSITMGPAIMRYAEPGNMWPEPSPLPQHLGHGWDIASSSEVSVTTIYNPQQRALRQNYTFPATLVFARTKSDPDFRWRELSFWSWATRNQFDSEPIALSPSSRDFQVAISGITSSWKIAYGPLTIDGEDEDAFRERWTHLFAKAAQRTLTPPTGMPLSDAFFNS
jgi:serine/threonine-protein kinase